MADLAETTPCLMPRADLLRLLELAGLDGTQTAEMVRESTADPVPVDPAGLLQTVQMARKEG